MLWLALAAAFTGRFLQFNQPGFSIPMAITHPNSSVLKTITVLVTVFLLNAPAFSQEEIQVHSYTNTKGFTFRNFSFTLTPENTILASDSRLKAKGYSRNASNYRHEILDENSINFTEYGQFQVFIPQEKFSLPHKATTFIIARMPQTSPQTQGYKEKVEKKQQLYKKIAQMVKEKKGSVDVVFEFPYPNSETIDANIFFRTYNGEYIDRVGKL